MSARRIDDPRQRKLPYTRGEQLALRRKIDLPPTQKFLLWALDDFIRDNRSWTLSIGDLMEATGLKKTATRDGLNALRDATVIFWEPCADGRREYFIAWSNIEEAVEAPRYKSDPEGDSEDDASGPQWDELPSPPDGLTVRQTEWESARRTDESVKRTVSPPNGLTVRQTDSHIMNSALNTALYTAPPPPPSAQGKAVVVGELIKGESPVEEFHEGESHEDGGPEIDEAIIAVQACGVTDAGNAVQAAVHNGWNPQQILDTVEFFASMRPAWDGGAVVARLKRPGSHLLAITDGWPPPNTPSTQLPHSGDPLEGRFGRKLDAMPDVGTLMEALAKWRPGDREFIRERCPDNPRGHHQGRRILLETLEAIERSRQQKRSAGVQPSAS